MKHHYFFTALALLLVVLGSCAGNNREGFAIYLGRDESAITRPGITNSFALQDRPLITLDDILWYRSNTHEIGVAPEAARRIAALEVPVKGKPFAVCLNGKSVYTGAFWTPISSLSFDGIVIIKPLASQDSNIIRLEEGYPSPSFYAGPDPRNNPDLMQSLRNSGKLKSN